MADCNITFTGASGQTSAGIVTLLTIEGTVKSCGEWVPGTPPMFKFGEVRVTVSCVGANKITKPAKMKSGNPLTGGEWIVVFTPADNLPSLLCACDGFVRVEAVCVIPGPTGTPPKEICEPVEATLPLECAEKCDVKTGDDVSSCIQPPDPDAGKRAVSFQAFFTSPFPGLAAADLYLEQAIADSGSTNGPGVVELNFQGNLDPKTYTFTVVITAPAVCNSTDFSSLVDVPSCSIGACCLADGTCQITTEDACQEMGGDYKGDDSSCDECRPGEPKGACCLPGGCVITTEADCKKAGGEYKGDGTTCAECATHGDGDGDTGGACGAFTYVVAALLGLTLTLALVIATFYCLGIPVPPIVWGIVLGFAIATAFVIAFWYALCAFGICPCPTGCDWLQISWIATLANAIVALFLAGCCPAQFLVSFGLFTAASVAFGAWIQACKPDACAALAGLLVAVSTGATVALTYIISLFAPIAACGLTWVLVAAATLGGALAVALAACQEANP
jgi:hypothetical protein